MRPIRLLSGFFTVGLWTLLSRVMGFVRDLLIAAFLGSGPVADAFFAAFSLPNLFRRFFAEGAFNMAFVPLFAKKLEAEEDAKQFAEDAFSGLGFLLILLTLIGLVFMPALVSATAWGFRGDERFDLAVTYGRIAFPYVLLISLAALLSGVLNATGRFAAAAAAPVLLNLVFITVMAVTWVFGGIAALDFGLPMSWALPIAGVAQFGLVWFAAKRAGYALFPKVPKLTPELKRLMIIAVPAILANGVGQINLLVGRQVASRVEGAFSWLFYADRLYQLPLGVVGIAIGVVLLPELSRRLKAGDEAGGREAYNRAMEISLALTIPAAVALVVIAIPLTSVLFERGEFTSDDTASTALAVAVYALGLPAFVMHKALQPVFFAREDTKRPFYYALVAMVLNALIAIGLFPYIGYISAAIGTTVTGWAMVLQLWLGARGMGDAARFDDRFKSRIWRIVAASLAMGGVLWLIQLGFGPLYGMAIWRYFALAVTVLIGAASYFAFAQWWGGLRLAEIKGSLRRG